MGLTEAAARRVVEAAVRAIAEGHVLHVRAPREEPARSSHPAKLETDLSVGPYPQTGGFSIEDYSPAWTPRGRDGRRRLTRRNEHSEFASAATAMKQVVRLLSGRVEFLQAALRLRFADEIDAADEERAALADRLRGEQVLIRQGAAATRAGLRWTVGGGSGHGFAV